MKRKQRSESSEDSEYYDTETKEAEAKQERWVEKDGDRSVRKADR